MPVSQTHKVMIGRLLDWQPKLILAGASYRDRIVACAGALMGVSAVAILSALLGAPKDVAAMVVAPMGASAVLLFAIPASPLSQPWPVIGGNVVSALSGVMAYKLAPDLWVAAGLAVSMAMLLMTVMRCLHPPGGGTALLAVVGGSSVHAAGFGFAFWPVALNAMLLVASGLLFHRLSGHSYPHRSELTPVTTDVGSRFRSEDVDSALAELGETLDIDRDDLEVLLRLAERHAQRRHE
jgi:CBS domain-containing membrane protein